MGEAKWHHPADDACPWCGKDLKEEWGSVTMSYDSMLEAHVEDCDVYKREQGEMCTGDQYNEGN